MNVVSHGDGMCVEQKSDVTLFSVGTTLEITIDRSKEPDWEATPAHGGVIWFCLFCIVGCDAIVLSNAAPRWLSVLTQAVLHVTNDKTLDKVANKCMTEMILRVWLN